jgi:hypothetical protein
MRRAKAIKREQRDEAKLLLERLAAVFDEVWRIQRHPTHEPTPTSTVQN